MPRRRCGPTAPTSSASSCASACWSTSRSATSAPPSSASRCRCRWRWRRSALAGMQHGDGEILACRAAQAAGIPYTLSTMSICSIEDVAGAVDKPFWFQLYVMKDRGFVQIADRARGGRQVQRAGADHRPAGARPAPLRCAQRHDGAAGDPPAQRDRHRDQAGLGAEHRCAASARPSAISPATRRAAPTSRRWRHGSPRSSIRRCRGRTSNGSGACGRASSSSRACSMSRTRASRPRPAPTRSWCRTTAAASSTARRRRSRRCRRSPTRSAPRSRSCSTAASAPART